ncbi:MAG: hypothetical protein JNK04_11570 [Myxococcales bacterium]|nr:hypothetical protein [Myxococcales bacterium]
MDASLRGMHRAVIVFAFCIACDARPGTEETSHTSTSSALSVVTAPESAAGVASVAAASATAVVDASLSKRGIRWGLSCTPAKLTMATRDKLNVEISATNETKETLDTLRQRLSFKNEGRARLSFAFGNGHRDKKWTALPPGETLTESRAMGEALLPRTGDIEITLFNDGATATCTVHVDP